MEDTPHQIEIVVRPEQGLIKTEAYSTPSPLSTPPPFPSASSSQTYAIQSMEMDDIDDIEEESDPLTMPNTSSSTSSRNDENLQTVSIKLPPNMAVLVVPVNLTSVTEDDAMQLQQIGKRVAIIRGAMTNVAEFQVLPAMTFDAHSKTIGMETDIRQIVINEGDDSTGPTIQITPQPIVSEPEIIEEVEPVLPEAPKEPRPKIYSYIEAIRCGRCLEAFNDLVELRGHQKGAHQMMTIEVNESQSAKESAVSVKGSALDSAQLLSMEDKIAARLEKGEAKLIKKAASSRRINSAAARGRGSRGGRVGGGGGSAVTKPTLRAKGGRGKGSSLLSCHVCSLNFQEQDLFNAHLQTHAESGEVTTATESSRFFPEIMSEYVDDDDVVEVVETKQVKYTIVGDGAAQQFKGEATEHIITDASGNQIVVHAESQEQLQELLASLANGTLQMVNGSGSGGAVVSRETGEMALEEGSAGMFVMAEESDGGMVKGKRGS